MYNVKNELFEQATSINMDNASKLNEIIKLIKRQIKVTMMEGRTYVRVAKFLDSLN